MVQDLDQMHRDFRECVEEADLLLQKMQEQVINETVPPEEDWSRADELVTELRNRYNNICRSAREWIPEDEMPAEGMPACDFIEAARSSQIMMEQELRQTLQAFLSIRSRVTRFAAALAPYQEKVQLLLDESEGRSAGDPAFMMQQTKAPKALLDAIAIEDLYSDEGCALLDQLEEYYSGRVCQGVTGRLYYVDSQSLAESETQPPDSNAEFEKGQEDLQDISDHGVSDAADEEGFFRKSDAGIAAKERLAQEEGNDSCSTENAEDRSAPEQRKGTDSAPAENLDTPFDETIMQVEILFEEEDPAADPGHAEIGTAAAGSSEKSVEAEPAGETYDIAEEDISAGDIFEETQDIEADHVPADGPARESGMPEAAAAKGISAAADDRAFHDEAYLKMLADGRFYAAMAYVRTLAEENSYYASVCRQLAYALNDPMSNCSYNSESILNIYYYSSETMLPGYYVAAASLRNYFLNQFSYDYNLKTLRDMLSVNDTVKANPLLGRILFTLEEFKETVHAGIDRYADYREQERTQREERLKALRKRATNYCDNYCSGIIRENKAQRRFVETEKQLLNPGSDLCTYLTAVRDGSRDAETLELLKDFLRSTYVKDAAAICADNIDDDRIYHVIDENWDLAGDKVLHNMKSNALTGELRRNLFNKIRSIVTVLCDYVAVIELSNQDVNDPGFRKYRRIRTGLLQDIDGAIQMIEEPGNSDLQAAAGNAVLCFALREMRQRLDGSWPEGKNRYFYIGFLRSNQVLLDEEYYPILEDVPELPALSIRSRILAHCSQVQMNWETRLNEILRGGDDYGSARLILDYVKETGAPIGDLDPDAIDLNKAVQLPQKDAANQRERFIENLEMAQSYGQLDSTNENNKEHIIQIMDDWYDRANESGNFGFFARILDAFLARIHEDAKSHAGELEQSLAVWLQSRDETSLDENAQKTVAKIREWIGRQNYAAAEDLLNRLIMGDLEEEVQTHQTDHLKQFMEEHGRNYKKTMGRSNLQALLRVHTGNKDLRGAEKLLNNWPRGGKEDDRIKTLLSALGFRVDTVEQEEPLSGRFESYTVMLEHPKDGRRSYKHPIAAFGSEAEIMGFRVVCIYGNYDADGLIDIFREIGNAKNTIVLLDWALQSSERRALARKTKTDLRGKIFAVIDRVTIAYLIDHYSTTSVNRVLMEIIMPFASCQPYIYQSSVAMPPEMFIGRSTELEDIESPTGANILYGGRQLGKTALLRMARNDIDRNENNDRAILVDINGQDYRRAARTVSMALYDERFLKKEHVTEDWDEIARDIKNRLRETTDRIPYFLLLLDETDAFLESCEEVDYQPLNALKDIQGMTGAQFKFVVAGLRNVVRFKRSIALGNNSVLAHLGSRTVTPLKALEAKALLKEPLYYLGFRFPEDDETERLVSTILGTTNYFPGLIQFYCSRLIETLQRDYAGYSEVESPEYRVSEKHIKRALGDQTLQNEIWNKFDITLKIGQDNYYDIIALLIANLYFTDRQMNGCSAEDVCERAVLLDVPKIAELTPEQVGALMEEMAELYVLRHTESGRYGFTRSRFREMMGTESQVEDKLMAYMEG